jgi:signal recognition particle subunit SRP54
VVIVDTAGRLGIDEELMKQAADIRDAVEPDEVLFVVDAMIGQDAVTTAQAFLDGVGFDGVVLSKLDGDARGGAALSVAQVTGRQVMFASNGEKLEDFDVFHPDRMASRILGMGDMLSLIEKAEQTFDADEAAKTAAKLQKKGGKDFTLDDFLAQVQSVRKMGPITKIFGMLPGAAQFKDQLENFDEREVDRIEAVIHSMTPAERNDPNIINGSRRVRIANGSGTDVSTVSGLVERFFEARKMMSAVASGKGIPGLPGMPGVPGMSGRKAKQQAKKAKTKRGSGNPAKRAGQAAKAVQAQPEPGEVPAAFGGTGSDGADFELPAELKNLLDQQK